MSTNVADEVIKAFGGLTKAHDATGVPISTIQGWQKTGRIPRWRRAEIIASAERLEIELPEAFLKAKAAA